MAGVNGSDKFHAIMEAEMSMIPQSGRAHQNSFLTFLKVLDYDYVEQRRMITAEEAVGLREVQARQSPGGPGQPQQ